MRQNHPAGMLLAIFSVVLIALCVLCAAGKGMIFYKQSATQKSILRGVESISDATMATTDALSDIMERASLLKYQEYKALADSQKKNPMQESEISNFYKEAVLARLLNEVGGEEGLYDYLCSVIQNPVGGTITVSEDKKPYLYIERDKDGIIQNASIRDVRYIYNGIPGTKREENVRYDIVFPEVVFYGGSDELFDYCMLASKGIYITGATSSFVGNIYAGNHTAQESRDIEIAYGEIGSYGGLNFLSTQVGIEADEIISIGDINLSGSFVIFNSENQGKLKLFGNKIRKMRGYLSDSMYSVDGDFYENSEMPEDVLEDYLKMVDFAQLSLSGLYDIPFYYDSQNDADYKGEYRKIVSSEDVEIDTDVTGLIFTPGNVIINAGCNVEGLVMCGDRIYIQGNNSIVSNASVVKSILSSEIAKENEEDALAFNESAGVGDDEIFSSGIKYYAKDYIGGFVSPGIKKQVYYVVPYQE